MDERKQAELSPPPVGGASLLVVFAVLCLTVFALLSLSTVRADDRLSQASARAVSGYYAADCQAQELLARLKNGEEPEGVELYGSDPLYAEYSCSISATQELQVRVRFDGGLEGVCTVLRWQSVPTGAWEEDDSLDLWDGIFF